jgi:pSer/pThr/pTyr-binding forkhead associated (FHA) protein
MLSHLAALTEGPSIPLDKPILLVGRHPECDVQIESRKISRRHCCLAQVSDYLVVRDLGSTNGVRINGVRVLEGRLKEGDELTIGGHRYRVASETTPEPSPKERQESAKKASLQPKPEPSAYDHDDILESCDEPIALAEPFSPERSPSPKPELPRRSERPSARIIPEKLNLAPVSDADLRPPAS